MTNLDKLNNLICDVFNIKDKSELSDDLGPDELESWDSLAQVELVTGLEEKFGLSIDVLDASRMYTVGDIKKIVKKCGVEV